MRSRPYRPVSRPLRGYVNLRHSHPTLVPRTQGRLAPNLGAPNPYRGRLRRPVLLLRSVTHSIDEIVRPCRSTRATRLRTRSIAHRYEDYRDVFEKLASTLAFASPRVGAQAPTRRRRADSGEAAGPCVLAQPGRPRAASRSARPQGGSARGRQAPPLSSIVCPMVSQSKGGVAARGRAASPTRGDAHFVDKQGFLACHHPRKY
jgi:hypothetical protein